MVEPKSYYRRNTDTDKSYLELYDKQGFCIVPLKPRDKRPALQSWASYQTRRSTEYEWDIWWGDPDTDTNNVGVVTGDVSDNLVVLDFDNVVAARYAVTAMPWLRDTMQVETGRGYHFYIKTSKSPGATFVLKHDKLEGVHHVKANGGYVVAPPSVHPSGKTYEFVDDAQPVRIHIESLVAALKEAGFKSADTPEEREARPAGYWEEWIRGTYGEGERNNKIAVLAGILRDGHKSREIAMELARCWNQLHCVPPLSDREVESVVRSMYSPKYQGR